MKYKLISLLVAVGFSLCAFSAENNVTAMLSNAEKFYAAKEYDKAIEEYSQVMDHNVVSSDILYNLGNCYYHNDDWGNAVVSYLEAQKLDPSNDKINGNLTFLLSKVEDKNAAEAADKSVRVAVDEKGFFESLYTALVTKVGSDAWAVIGIITFILTIAGVVLYIFLQNVLAKKIGFFGGIVCLILSIVANVFAFMAKSDFYAKDKAVVIEYSVKLKSEAKDSASEVSIPLHAGTVLEVLNTYTDINDDKWVKLRLNSEISGWTKENTIKLV